MNTPGMLAEEPGPRILDADHGEALLPDSGLGPPWWAPAPRVVEAAEGTFRFQFRVTGHDEAGDPSIAATVTAVLRYPPPPPEHPDARPVERTGVAVRLRIPYIDADTGTPGATELPAEATERDGVVHCRVEISGPLARAAYGALSTPGFQPDDVAGLIVDSTFVAVQETEAAWAMVPSSGLTVAEAPPVSGQVDRAVLVPVRRGWPYEEPPREEHPIPVEHPEWRERVTSRVRVPAVSEVVGIGSARLLDVVDQALRLTGPEVPLPLPRASRFVLASDETPLLIDALDGLDVDIGGNGLAPDGTSPQPESFSVDMAVLLTRQHRLPLLIPCRDHPTLYRQDPGTGAEPEPIGCQDAFQLGRVPARRYAQAPAHDRERRYTVWESLQQPATYLVVPAHYRVARDAAGQPELEWLQVFDAGVDAGLPCVLQVRCVPDLSPAELAELESRLRADAGGRDVRLLLPTSPSVGSTGASVRDSTVAGGLRAVLDDDAVRLALRVDYSDAVVVVTQLRGGEAVAQVAFETGDPRLTLATTAHLDVDELAGPYPDGPVRATGTGLVNGADTAATVIALWTRSGTGDWARAPLDPPVPLPPHGEVTLAAATAGTVPEVRLDPADPAQLAVRNVYLENLHTAVLILRDVDLIAAGISAVELTFTVSGVAVARAALPAAVPSIEVTLAQPLVADRPSFDRKVTVSATLTRNDGSAAPAPPPPVVVDLSAGAIIRLSHLIGG
ncbi:hypothetical protein ACTMSW_26165 [Micromonospora sp. BQ11]|uniref:hypothetical protein n=1 Tax=Micromonospora sp. BQ11 TaxID=3452212 RepID=UPI003F8C62F1